MKRSSERKGEGWAIRAAVAPIELYRKTVSAWKKPCCRYLPTCSEYAVDAIRKYGPLRGLAKASLRVLRCNPLFPGGYDPA